MDSTLIFVREICLAVWFGGLVAIDVVEAPVRAFGAGDRPKVRFFASGVSMEQVTAIGGQVFKWFAWFQLLIGLIALIISASIPNLAPADVRPSSVLTLITIMWSITLVQCIFFIPRMFALRLLFYSSGVTSSIRREFGIVHAIYILADAAKALIALWLLYRLSCAH